MSRMTATSIPALLEPIQERLDAATPGPWNVYRNDREVNMWVLSGDGALECNLGYLGNRPENDAVFIANSPTDTARLLAAVQAAIQPHKPERGVVYDPDDGDDKEMEYCETCSDSPWLEEATVVAWPCPTVSAVEAALRNEA